MIGFEGIEGIEVALSDVIAVVCFDRTRYAVDDASIDDFLDSVRWSSGQEVSGFSTRSLVVIRVNNPQAQVDRIAERLIKDVFLKPAA